MKTQIKTKIISFDEYGSADVLKLVEIPLAEPKANEVRIKIEAISLNRADAMFRENKYAIQPKIPGSRIGTDAAGVIEAIGEDVIGFKIGDRVIVGLGFDVSQYGTHGESAILPAQFVAKYPDFLTPQEAASMGMPYITVWGGLIEQGQMKKGDYVLITAASSSIGVAAIQLAKEVGAITIAATRTAAKKQGLLDVGAAYVIVTDEENLSESVRKITNGKGARLIFDPIVGGMLETLAEAVAPEGVIFLYGALSTSPATIPLFPTFMKEINFRGYNVYPIYSSPKRFKQATEYIFSKLKSGKLKIIIDKIFPLTQYADAHRYLESNEQIGRIVITV